MPDYSDALAHIAQATSWFTNARRLHGGSMREQRNLLSWCERIAGIRIGRLGRNAMLATAALGARLLIQVGYLILLSRWLGPQGYGLFAAFSSDRGRIVTASYDKTVQTWGASTRDQIPAAGFTPAA